MRSKVPQGVACGRFQPFHLGHLEYVLAAKKQCDFLWVGIPNPEPSLTKRDPADPHRSLPTSNPFTYHERFLMIRESLLEAGVPRKQFDIVPFPINFPERIPWYAPKHAKYFVTVYDDWGRKRVSLLQSAGLDVCVLWERTPDSKVTTGGEIRSMMQKKQRWQSKVPKAVAKTFRESGADERIRSFQPMH